MQEEALRLLAEFENPELARRSLDYDLSGKVRNQDFAFQLAVGLHIDTNRERTWNFIKANWGKVSAQLTTNSGGDLVIATGSFCSAEARDEVQNFFSTHKVPATERALKNAIQRINGCIEFRALQEPKLKDWLGGQAGR